MYYGKTTKMCWLDAFYSHFQQQPTEKKKITFKNKRKVEFDKYGGTVLHDMLHAEKKKITWHNGTEETKIVFCLNQGVKAYGAL